MLRAALQRLAKHCLKPSVWRPAQYPPRPLRAPEAYSLTTKAGIPAIAIVTPLLNQAAFVRAAIDSVISQRYANIAYVIQDGGSSDGTLDILGSYGATLDWTSGPDGGQSDAINKGFARCSGDIMAWLNGDDMLLPGSLAYVADFLASNPDVDVVYGNRIFINSQGYETGRCMLPDHDPGALWFADYIPQETMFWRRRVWENLSVLDTSLHFTMDWDFKLRAQEAGFKFHHLPRFLGCFRVHPDQKSRPDRFAALREMDILRARHFGRILSDREIKKGIEMYLLRQVIAERFSRLRRP